MYKLQPNNPFTNEPSQIVKRLSDNAVIPFDPANTDYQAYIKWLAEGNEPLQPDNNQ